MFMQLKSVFPVTHGLVQGSEEFVLNQENSLAVRVGVVFASVIAGFVAVLVDISIFPLRGIVKLIELVGIFPTENIRTAFYGRLKGEEEQEYLFVPSEQGFTMWGSDGSNKGILSSDEIQERVVKIKEAVSSPKRLGNCNNDCFFNSLFQLIMVEDQTFHQAFCEKRPFLTSYMSMYHDQKEDDKPLFLDDIRFHLSEMGHCEDWKKGQHDPVEVLALLADEWEANPRRMQVKNIETHPNGGIVRKKDPMYSNICALVIPPKEAEESSIPFIKLLESFQAPLSEKEEPFLKTRCWKQPPNYLTFQINRNVDGKKINDLIDIPEEISLESKYFVESQESSTSYELSPGFIVHDNLGMFWNDSNIESGHYIAYISKPIDEKRPELGKQYFLCDDDYIKIISREEYLKKAQQACFLILKKK
jgi:hypothetical protein